MRIKFTPTRIRTIKPTDRERMITDKTTPHFALRVRPNGTKRFIHLYTDPQTNKQSRITIGDPQTMPLENARSVAMRLNDEIADEREKPPPAPLFADYANNVWMPMRGKMIKPVSHARHRLALDKQLLPNFGHLPIDAITKPVILRWFTRYSDKFPGGANRTLEILVTILRHANEAGLIERNPAIGIIRNPKRRGTRFLSDDERERLLHALDHLPWRYGHYADALRLLLFTGCRRGEIVNLRWSEIGEGKLNLEDSKTGPRTVWLSDEAERLLKWRREGFLDRKPITGPFVFPHRHNQEKAMNPASLDSFWYGLRKRLGMPDVRLHDLRHSFATQAIRQGVPVPVVSKLLGHKKIDMTMRYTHASNADAKAAAERIGKRITGLLEEDGGGY